MFPVDINMFRGVINEEQLAAVRWFESATLLKPSGKKKHVIVIITETNVFVGKHPQLTKGIATRPSHIGLENVTCISRIPDRVNFFVDDKMNEITQKVKIGYRPSRRAPSSFVVLCAWEATSRLFFHLKQAWINMMARLALPGIDISIAVQNGRPVRELYLESVSEMMLAPPLPYLKRSGLLYELSHGAVHSRELRKWCFQHGKLWKHCLREIEGMRATFADRASESLRRQQLIYVHALHVILHAIIFNSEMLSGCMHFLNPTPYSFGEMLCILTVDYSSLMFAAQNQDSEASANICQPTFIAGLDMHENALGAHDNGRVGQMSGIQSSHRSIAVLESNLNQIDDVQVQLLSELYNLVEHNALIPSAPTMPSIAAHECIRRRIKNYALRMLTVCVTAVDGPSSLSFFYYCKLMYSLMTENYQYGDVFWGCEDHIKSLVKLVEALDLSLFFNNMSFRLATLINLSARNNVQTC